MVKRRIFLGFVTSQTKWLNAMSQKGYRLVKTGILEYVFEDCEKGKYIYAIEYVGNRSFEEEKDYKAFLESCGYKVFYKNINIDFTLGKATIRPLAKGTGKATVSGTNKELLIIEKENDGKPFELHTTAYDKLNCLESILKGNFLLAFLFFLGALLIPGTLLNVVFALLGLLTIVLSLKTVGEAIREKKKAEMSEEPESQKVSLKKYITILGVILLLAVGYRLYFGGSVSPTSYSATKVMSSDLYFRGIWTYSTKMTDGHISKRMIQTRDGVLNAEIETNGGKIGITVSDSDGNIVYESKNVDGNFSVTVPKKARVTLTCTDWDGKVKITY